MSFVVSEIHGFLNWHVLRLAATAARASKLLAARAQPGVRRAGFSSPVVESCLASRDWRPAAHETGSRQDLSRASFENPPFVAWHSGGQNPTGPETRFWSDPTH